jgi:hypothetical protein
MTTNFEKIKNMTLDEMARWLSNWCKIFSDEVYTSDKYIKFRLNDYKKATKKWLQQESEG